MVTRNLAGQSSTHVEGLKSQARIAECKEYQEGEWRKKRVKAKELNELIFCTGAYEKRKKELEETLTRRG